MEPLITSNDNWNSPPAPDIEEALPAPSNDLELLIIRTLDPGLYTAVVNGKNGRDRWVWSRPMIWI